MFGAVGLLLNVKVNTRAVRTCVVNVVCTGGGFYLRYMHFLN